MSHRACGVLAAILALPCPALAQDEEPVLEPPVLIEFVPAQYPEEAFAKGLKADVILAIKIDAEGFVTSVDVVTPAGSGFDEAAVDAAWEFRFEPATADGEPIESVIEYRYRFFMKEKPKEPAKKPPDEEGEVEEVEEEQEEEEEEEEEEYVTVVKGEKEKTEQVVKHTLDTKEILMMPGTGGDLLKSVQNLPGMARAPANMGLLIIRGSSPGDSIILMEDHPIPIAYHFGALSSVINSEFIKEIEFIPGNFSVRYGRGTGGMVNVKPKWEVPESWHVVADVDVIDASLWAFGPLGDKGYIGASIRRSYIDAVIEAGGKLIDNVGMTVAPVYWDYQLFFMYRPTPRDEIRFSNVGSNDKFRFLFSDVGDDPTITGIGFESGFHVGQFRWKHTFSPTITYEASMQLGWIGSEGSIGTNVKFDVDSFIVSHRQDLRFELGRWTELTIGIDLQPNLFSATALAPALGTEADSFGSAELGEMDLQEWMWELAAFAEIKLKPHENVDIVPGVRVDYHAVIQDFELQPRLILRYRPHELTTLSAGVGLYTQSPSLPTVIEPWGNPDLIAQRAIHYAVGLEQDLPWAWLDLTFQLFYKTLDRLVEPTPDYVERDGQLTALRYNNEGRGRAYGLELLLRIQPDHFIYGWLAYTLSKSERWNTEIDRWIPFNFDQPHLLTVLLGFELPRNWNVS
ncbi:MAG: TonB-dependent receptor, partial [Deltaproteobacteria bacterium]|nr:TonB-dependent receptor [Deltaproteobacteria bacterium]